MTRPLTIVVLAALGLVAMTATPALAHGVGGVGPSNYETRLFGIEPGLDDLEVSVVDLGDRVEVTNRSDDELTVLGYESEPYLRIGPAGVFENQASPATWANRDRYAEVAVPADVDAGAEPVWTKVSDGQTARFHWHLAHWMATTRPGVVDAAPGDEHHLLDWELVMERGGARVVASGELVWVPAPSPAPVLLVAAGLGIATVVFGLTRGWRWVLVAALAVMGAAEVVHVAGLWDASTSGLVRKLFENLYSIIGIAVATLAIARLGNRRRDPYDEVPLALVAAIVLTVAGGLADIPSLTSSQLATSLPDSVARSGIAMTLGVGVGAVIVSAVRMRRPRAPAEAPL